MWTKRWCACVLEHANKTLVCMCSCACERSVGMHHGFDLENDVGQVVSFSLKGTMLLVDVCIRDTSFLMMRWSICTSTVEAGKQASNRIKKQACKHSKQHALVVQGLGFKIFTDQPRVRFRRGNHDTGDPCASPSCTPVYCPILSVRHKSKACICLLLSGLWAAGNQANRRGRSQAGDSRACGYHSRCLGRVFRAFGTCISCQGFLSYRFSITSSQFGLPVPVINILQAPPELTHVKSIPFYATFPRMYCLYNSGSTN